MGTVVFLVNNRSYLDKFQGEGHIKVECPVNHALVRAMDRVRTTDGVTIDRPLPVGKILEFYIKN